MEPKTFVVPLDGSPYAERAVPIACALAHRVGGRVLLFSAEFAGPVAPDEYLDEVANRDFGCPVDTYVARGRYPGGALVEMVDAFADRVVCMTTHGRGRVGYAALGSVAEDVLRRSGRPTVLVGPECRADAVTQSDSLLIACAGDAWPAPAAESVRAFAAMLGLDARVAVVAHPLDTESAEHPERVVDPVAAQFALERDDVKIVHAEYPQSAIETVIEAAPVALVAMGTHDRAGLARLALGSVTMSVVRNAPCPVLAVPLHPHVEEA